MDQSQHASQSTAGGGSGVGNVDQQAELFLAGMDEWEKERECRGVACSCQYYDAIADSQGGPSAVVTRLFSLRSGREGLQGDEAMDGFKAGQTEQVWVGKVEYQSPVRPQSQCYVVVIVRIR